MEMSFPNQKTERREQHERRREIHEIADARAEEKKWRDGVEQRARSDEPENRPRLNLVVAAGAPAEQTRECGEAEPREGQIAKKSEGVFDAGLADGPWRIESARHKRK